MTSGITTLRRITGMYDDDRYSDYAERCNGDWMTGSNFDDDYEDE